MSLIQAILLGVVQGLTEFLPVSSSGHLVLARQLLGVEAQGIVFEVFVHFATMIAIIVVFRRRLRWIISRLGKSGEDGCGARRIVLLLVVGSIPAGLAGLLLSGPVERAFESVLFVSLALLATGSVVWATRFRSGADRPIAMREAGVIGCAQAMALLPGISRSGWTIATALLLGVSAEEAVEFSFLLALPAIAGATLRTLLSLRGGGVGVGAPLALVAGMLAAFISGWLALLFLVRIVRRGRLARFAYYCWAVGLLGLVLWRW